MILDAVLKEGDPLPSVRSIAAEYRIDPLTVLKGYQQLVAEELVEMKRGRGMFINAGARDRLLRGEREKFLKEDEIWDVILFLYDHTGTRPRAREEAATK